MRNVTRTILAVAVAGTLLAGVARAQDDSDALRRPPTGSIAAQLRLKQKLLAAQSGTTLAATLQHNRRQWESLSPEQRDRIRQVAVAFLQQNPDRQLELIEQYDRFIRMSAERQRAYRQRERWLKAVVASFTPQERDQLRNLASDERARRLIARRDELVAHGKLTLEPATQPASAPATRPTD
jgi:TRAP-type C4-dicarboxylate transport system substrate-binding protein